MSTSSRMTLKVKVAVNKYIDPPSSYAIAFRGKKRQTKWQFQYHLMLLLILRKPVKNNTMELIPNQVSHSLSLLQLQATQIISESSI